MEDFDTIDGFLLGFTTVRLCAERGTSMAYSYCYMLFINRLKFKYYGNRI